jgi:hypothetical protein
MYPWINSKGDIAIIIKVNIQLAENAITKADKIVDIFWTIKDRESPTSLLTVEASVDNLAPIAPLKKAKAFIFASNNIVS